MDSIQKELWSELRSKLWLILFSEFDSELNLELDSKLKSKVWLELGSELTIGINEMVNNG